MSKLDILIADTHILIIEGIISILSKNKHTNILGTVSNSKELFKKIIKETPDIVIIDFDIENHFSLDDIICLRKKHPYIKILIISANKNKKDIIKIINLGVKAYLLKECEKKEILNAIKSMAYKKMFLCDEVMNIIGQKTQENKNQSSSSDHKFLSLSSREIQIIQYITEGNSTKSIATKLFLSFHTVNTHRKNIFRKLNVHNTSELITCAIHEGIVDF
jgi:DNA-binding NarL/FixJ family response regulator